MQLCKCWHIEHGEGVCYGTPERDICNCDGDERHCDFYEHVRKRVTGKETKYMTPEDYLMQIKDISLRIKSLEGELHDAEAEEDTEYAEELSARISADIARYKELRLRIRDEIQQIGDNKLSCLLTEYYVRGKTWEMVAEALGVKSTKNVREGLHTKALKLFAATFPKYFLI